MGRRSDWTHSDNLSHFVDVFLTLDAPLVIDVYEIRLTSRNYKLFSLPSDRVRDSRKTFIVRTDLRCEPLIT